MITLDHRITANFDKVKDVEFVAVANTGDIHKLTSNIVVIQKTIDEFENDLIAARKSAKNEKRITALEEQLSSDH